MIVAYILFTNQFTTMSNPYYMVMQVIDSHENYHSHENR
jgi:hypothetical protein